MRVHYLIVIILFSCCKSEIKKVINLKNKFKLDLALDEYKPVIYDGKVFIVANGNNIVGINTVTETLEFDYWETGGIHEFSMDNSIIAFVGKNWKLKVLDVSISDSSWVFDALPSVSTNVIIEGTKVYFGTIDCHIYCVDITKRKIDWKYDVKDRIGNDIVVSKDYVYIRFSKNWLLSLSKATGNENLSIKRDQDYFSLSVLNDNLILTEKFHIAGLESKSLEENWRVSTSILPSPFAIDKGIIYARVARDSMSATEIKSGKELWRRDIDYSMFNPLIGLIDDL